MKKLLTTFLLLCSFTSIAAAEIPYLDKVQPAYQQAAETFVFNFTSDAELAAAADMQQSTAAGRETIVIPAANDIPALTMYIYRPQQQAASLQPAIYYTHGGGFLFRKELDFTDRYQQLADNTGAIVVTPRYRLSTEAPFPAALEDAYAGLCYLKQNAAQLKIDDSRIMLMGGSAGGGLAASLALYNRDHANIPLCGQILIYPMLDYRTATDKSPYNSISTGHIGWNRPTNAFAWKKLRGNQEISKNMLQYFSPALANNLSDLPPALIYVGGLDLFVNEDIAYANKLIEAGNDTTLYVVPGLYHAFDIAVPQAQATQEFWQRVYEASRHMLTDKK